MRQCLGIGPLLILSVSRISGKGAGLGGRNGCALTWFLATISSAVNMNFTLECEQEVDGRWIAEVPELPGVLAYGSSSADAMAKAEVLALRVMAERLENGESEPVSIQFSLPLSA